MLSIYNNSQSLKIQAQLSRTSKAMDTSITRLSTGYRINSAKDDAAGLAISDRMKAQISGMTVASRNVNDGISMLQVAEGAYNSASDILIKMRDLTVSAQQGTVSTEDLANMDKEYQSLAKALGDGFKNIDYNGKKILSTDAGDFVLQVGANAGETFTVTTTDASTILATPGALTDAATAKTAMDAVDAALKTVADQRTDYGTNISRLEYTFDNLQNSITNTTDARSRIVDADYAVEMSNLTSRQILQQAASAMLSQANAAPNMVLSLLRG